MFIGHHPSTGRRENAKIFRFITQSRKDKKGGMPDSTETLSLLLSSSKLRKNQCQKEARVFDSPYLYIVVLTILFLFSAFFSSSETALFSLDALRIKYLVFKKRRGALRLEAIRQRPDQVPF
jgi:hypothetical protein